MFGIGTLELQACACVRVHTRAFKLAYDFKFGTSGGSSTSNLNIYCTTLLVTLEDSSLPTSAREVQGQLQVANRHVPWFILSQVLELESNIYIYV